MSNVRIGVVQRGDWVEARRAVAAGEAETYRGQRYTTDALSALLAGRPHLIVSKGQAEPEVAEGEGVCVALPEPSAWARPLPGRWREKLRARWAIRRLERFGATHLLLRLNDVVGCELLRWAQKRNLPTAVILAARFDADHPADARFAALANAPNVAFVANHNRVATRSMIDCGLSPEKAVAWDYEPDVRPQDNPPKTRDPAAPQTIAYAGQMIVNKGVGDLLDAVQKLRDAGRDVRLTAFGEGDDLPNFRDHPAARGGAAELPGRVGNDVVQRAMREADVVCVPTRPAFAEALPLVIGEGLAARTPLVLSDHPIFAGYFAEGTGVTFFPAADAAALAGRLAALADGSAAYAALSESTAAAWQSFQIDTTFADVLARLRDDWRLGPTSRGPAADK